MKFNLKKVSIAALAAIGIVIVAIIVKNIIIEQKIEQRFNQLNIKAKSINCSGLIDVECLVQNTKISNLPLVKSFDFYIESIAFDNPKILDKIDRTRKIEDSDKFNIIINNGKFIAKNKKESVNIIPYLNIKKDIQKTVLHLKKSVIVVSKVNNGYKVSMDINHKEIEDTLYNIYKLQFLELKFSDSPIIAMGFNISLGVASTNVIPKEKFLKQSLPMLIELLSSEISSRDWFISYDKSKMLSKILNDILTLNGKKSYTIKLN